MRLGYMTRSRHDTKHSRIHLILNTDTCGRESASMCECAKRGTRLYERRTRVVLTPRSLCVDTNLYTTSAKSKKFLIGLISTYNHLVCILSKIK
jgi:hypothetical protein